MRNKTLLVVLALLLPLSVQADPLFGKEWAGDRELPLPWGIGINFFSMDQDYQIESLTFMPPPAFPIPPIANVDAIIVTNDIFHTDIKFDVWLLPFLNVFAIFGQIDGETHIDLSNVGIPLPPSAQMFAIDYDGDVYGAGAVIAVGGDRWFASVTGTFSDTSLGGSFNSSVEAVAIQPRLGLRLTPDTEFWIGGYFIQADESHSGIIDLDLGAGPIPIDFAVTLSEKDEFNFSFGAHTMFSKHWEATVEYGFGDRDTMLANLAYRF